jgi:hypothetical protein
VQESITWSPTGDTTSKKSTRHTYKFDAVNQEKRTTCEEVKTPCFQIGDTGAKRVDEAPWGYVPVAATGCICVPAFLGGVYFCPHPLSV